MTPIPKALRAKLAHDPWYKHCVLAYTNECQGHIQFHHVWIYAGRQIQEAWAILPVCEHHHDLVKKSRQVKENIEHISMCLATTNDLAKYPKTDWVQVKHYLKSIKKLS